MTVPKARYGGAIPKNRFISSGHEFASTKRVLLMDDEEMLRRMGKSMLARLGYGCETVSEGGSGAGVGSGYGW